jgi:hypothetical protein
MGKNVTGRIRSPIYRGKNVTKPFQTIASMQVVYMGEHFQYFD